MRPSSSGSALDPSEKAPRGCNPHSPQHQFLSISLGTCPKPPGLKQNSEKPSFWAVSISEAAFCSVLVLSKPLRTPSGVKKMDRRKGMRPDLGALPSLQPGQLSPARSRRGLPTRRHLVPEALTGPTRSLRAVCRTCALRKDCSHPNPHQVNSPKLPRRFPDGANHGAQGGMFLLLRNKGHRIAVTRSRVQRLQENGPHDVKETDGTGKEVQSESFRGAYTFAGRKRRQYLAVPAAPPAA